MKKLIIIALAASGAAIAQAQAETPDQRGGPRQFRAEMRALIAGDGMDVAALANLMQERATARFAALDGDGDGIVTKDDVLAASAERAQRRFERLGPNEDGIVKRDGRTGSGKHGERGGRAERAERGTERRAQMPEEMREMHARFRTMMRDGMDLDAFSGFARERASARFDIMDADGNGELTVAEFTARVSERAERVFARMDRNDDGKVTSQDRPRRAGKRGDGPRNKD